eukprot:g201.t1
MRSQRESTSSSTIRALRVHGFTNGEIEEFYPELVPKIEAQLHSPGQAWEQAKAQARIAALARRQREFDADAKPGEFCVLFEGEPMKYQIEAMVTSLDIVYNDSRRKQMVAVVEGCRRWMDKDLVATCFELLREADDTFQKIVHFYSSFSPYGDLLEAKCKSAREERQSAVTARTDTEKEREDRNDDAGDGVGDSAGATDTKRASAVSESGNFIAFPPGSMEMLDLTKREKEEGDDESVVIAKATSLEFLAFPPGVFGDVHDDEATEGKLDMSEKRVAEVSVTNTDTRERSVPDADDATEVIAKRKEELARAQAIADAVALRDAEAVALREQLERAEAEADKLRADLATALSTSAKGDKVDAKEKEQVVNKSRDTIDSSSAEAKASFSNEDTRNVSIPDNNDDVEGIGSFDSATGKGVDATSAPAVVDANRSGMTIMDSPLDLPPVSVFEKVSTAVNSDVASSSDEMDRTLSLLIRDFRNASATKSPFVPVASTSLINDDDDNGGGGDDYDDDNDDECDGEEKEEYCANLSTEADIDLSQFGDVSSDDSLDEDDEDEEAKERMRFETTEKLIARVFGVEPKASNPVSDRVIRACKRIMARNPSPTKVARKKTPAINGVSIRETRNRLGRGSPSSPFEKLWDRRRGDP